MRRLLALPAALLAVLAWAATRLRSRRLRRLGARARAAAGALAGPRRARVHRAAERAARAGDAAAGGRRRRGAGERAAGGQAARHRRRRASWTRAPTGSTGTRSRPRTATRSRARSRSACARTRARRRRWRPGRWRAGGIVRIAARIALYVTVLMLAAALLLPLLIGRPRGWPVPELDPGDEGGRVDLEDVRARERRLRGDLAWAAVVAAVVATFADAADAARGLDVEPDGATTSAATSPGSAARSWSSRCWRRRCCATAGRAPRPRAVVVALGAVAASGHAGSADPRVPSILNDWLHLVSGALWLGGIGLLVLLWWPVVRFTRARLAGGDRARGAGAVRADRDRRVPRRRHDRARLARHPARARRRAVGHGLRAAAGGQDRRRRADRGGELPARAAAAAAAARRRRAATASSAATGRCGAASRGSGWP